MSFSWDTYIVIADELKQIGDNLLANHNSDHAEAAFRSSISRSYYALFRPSRDYLEKRSIYLPSHSGADHRKVKKYMKIEDYQIFTTLVDLSRWRTACDYDNPITDPTVNLNPDDVLFQIARATNDVNRITPLIPP